MAGRKSLENEKPIVTLDAFLRTYTDSSHPQANQMKGFLEEKGFLPLTYTSPLFPDLNIFVSAIIWGGSIYEGSCNRPNVILNLDKQTLESLEEGISELELGFNQGRNIKLGKNGAAYARLISQIPGIFFSTGNKVSPDRKAYREVTLPDYLIFLTDNYMYLSHKDKNIARKVIADNLKMLLQNRLYRERRLSSYVKLFENSSNEIVRNFADRVLKMFNTVYPSIGLTEESISVRDSLRNGGTNKRYISTIGFKSDNIINAIRHYNIFDIIFDRKFQPLGKRTSYSNSTHF